MKYCTLFSITILLWLTSCTIDSSHGAMEQTGNVEVFYKNEDLKTQAKRFGEMLDTLGYGVDGKVSFQLLRDQNTVHINMVTKEQYHTDKSLDMSLNAISLLASMEVFPADSVQLHVTSPTFSRKRSLEKIKVAQTD